MAELAAHAWHDPLRVAEAVDRGARLSPVLDLCAWCVALYVDLVSLTRALPTAAVPRRSRDFTLSDVEAQRLGARRWRVWSSRVGSARDSVTRPLAVGFTTLGLAGLLLTVGPVLAQPAGAAGGSESVPMMGLGAAAAPSVQPSIVAPGTVKAVPSAPPGDVRVGVVAADPASTVWLSVGLLVVGSGLFAVRRIAARPRRVR